MPNIRIGFSTDFNLTSELVGIGTTRPTDRLDVRGNIRSDNSAGGGGISTITRYDGFLNKEQRLANNISIGQTTRGNLNSLSGEIVISDGKEVTVSSGTSISAGRLDSLTVTNTFDLPQGGTNQRENTPEKGSTRFNQDLGQLEFYTGYEWRTVGSYAGSGRGRGVFGGGYAPSMTSLIEYINISTLGNSQNFGNLTESGASKTAMSSSTRGLFSGGGTPAYTNTIDYITIASEGNAIDFGDGTTLSSWGRNGLSSSTRGLMGGGFSAHNIIDYVTIATLGNALDFGDLTIARHSNHGLSSPTRGVWGGGNNAGTIYNIIEYITIASTGNAVNFGSLSEKRTGLAGFSSSTRGLFAGGYTPTLVNTIDFITIASTGNATDFGDATVSGDYKKGNSSNTRGINCGGRTPTITNTIEYVTIASTGNAQDFGDLSQPRDAMGVASDSHGGLGGF